MHPRGTHGEVSPFRKSAKPREPFPWRHVLSALGPYVAIVVIALGAGAGLGSLARSCAASSERNAREYDRACAMVCGAYEGGAMVTADDPVCVCRTDQGVKRFYSWRDDS